MFNILPSPIIRYLQQNDLFRRALDWYVLPMAVDNIERLAPHLQDGDSILDVGTGTGHVASLLMGKGHAVTSLDVQNTSFIPQVNPVLYDGQRFPFPDNTFDLALAITVLHHTPNPEHVLQEMSRVAKRIFILEDIYNNKAEQYATYLFDSLLNLEFIGHPHTNKTDGEWRTTFQRLGMHVLDAQIFKKHKFKFRHGIYHIMKT